MRNNHLISKSYAECYNKYRSELDEQATLILDVMSKHIESPENISVLDIGSGAGRLAIPIGQKVRRLVCVEPELSAANHLKSRSENNKVHIEIHNKLIQELSISELGYFDLVILSHIIHWLEPPSRFSSPAGFVRLGGYILLSFFDSDRLKNMLFYKISGKEILKIQEEDTPSKLDIERELQQLGFKIIEHIDAPLNVFYGDGKLEQIINSAGTLAWQKLKNSAHNEEFAQIKSQAILRLKKESNLRDTEFRTTILAKKVASQ